MASFRALCQALGLGKRPGQAGGGDLVMLMCFVCSYHESFWGVRGFFGVETRAA